jgi:hypothetical protein
MALLWLASPAQAEDPVSAAAATVTQRNLLGFSVLEIRGGLSAFARGGGAQLCAEVGIWRYAAIEACGSGAGFLNDGRAREMVHFRAEGTIPVLLRDRVELWAQPGVGIAEIEDGEDHPGFRFGPATSSDQQEGAGVEGAIGLKVRLWPHRRFFISGEFTLGAGWIPSAGVVLGLPTPWVPFLGWTTGLGF